MKKYSPHFIEKLLLAIGIFLFASEIVKQLILTFVLGGGHYNLWYFPFQLCSLPMYLLLIYPFLRKHSSKELILTFLATYNLLGGIAAFFDTSGMHYPLPVLTVHSYLWHILLIVIGLLSGILLMQQARFRSAGSTRYIHKKRQLKNTVWCRQLPSFSKITLLYLLFAFIAEYLNNILDIYGDINLFYINPDYRMMQVFFIKIGELFGNNYAILIYICATVLGAGILYVVWNLIIYVLKITNRIYQSRH